MDAPSAKAGTARAPLRLIRRMELRILLAFVGIVCAMSAFAALTSEVREGETSHVDRIVLLIFRAPGDLSRPIGPRWMQEAARDVTALGGFTVLTLVTVTATAILLLHGRRAQAAIFAATVVVAQAVAELVKHWIARPRPELILQHDLVYSSSFPSGHAMMSPVVYLTLAAFLAAGERRRAEKTLLSVLAAVLVMAIGVSRVYLGVHWPSDVLAGWALGGAVAFAATMGLVLVAAEGGGTAEVKAEPPEER
jgi:undecaprenyl-diphosphatase